MNEILNEDLLTQTVDKISSDALALPEINEKSLEANFFLNGSRKSNTLINNSDLNFSMKSQNKWLPFEFKKAIYVTKIVVRTGGFDTWNNMEISFEDAFTKSTSKSKVSISKDNIQFILPVRAFVGGFGILPDQKYSGNAKIIGIDVYGFE